MVLVVSSRCCGCLHSLGWSVGWLVGRRKAGARPRLCAARRAGSRWIDLALVTIRIASAARKLRNRPYVELVGQPQRCRAESVVVVAAGGCVGGLESGCGCWVLQRKLPSSLLPALSTDATFFWARSSPAASSVCDTPSLNTSLCLCRPGRLASAREAGANLLIFFSIFGSY